MRAAIDPGLFRDAVDNRQTRMNTGFLVTSSSFEKNLFDCHIDAMNDALYHDSQA